MNLLYNRLPERLLYPVMTLLLILSLSGCVTALKGLKSSREVKTAENVNTPIPVAKPAIQQVQSEGSLWQENGPFNQLFVDQKARRVGDIVTIKIIESSSASNKATTETERDSNLLGQITSFLGIERRWNKYRLL